MRKIEEVSGEIQQREAGPQRSGGERSEPERSEGPASLLRATIPGGASSRGMGPDPQVAEKALRRRFTVEYKLRILREADSCLELGQLGALLRREGLYSSTLAAWRRQRRQGTLQALTPRKRGRKALRRDPLVEEVERLKRRNQRLEQQLEKAQIVIEVQKKLAQLLSLPLPSVPEGDNK